MRKVNASLCVCLHMFMYYSSKKKSHYGKFSSVRVPSYFNRRPLGGEKTIPEMLFNLCAIPI